MARLEGTVSLTELPPRRGVLVDLYFFRIEQPQAPVPYGGDPPPEAAVDHHDVCEQTDLNGEDRHEKTLEIPFQAERAPGHYYLQLRVTLFRSHGGKMFAQLEQFFFGRRPVHLVAEQPLRITLPVTWPSEPPEALYHYGVVRPRRSRPWWRLW
jgi:hypothetical protein